MDTYWRKQGSEPLFPDLLWSRPEQRNAAGKLLIIGGNLHAFSAPAEAFSNAEKAGAGTVRVILPDATKKIVGRVMEHVEYAPSTPSGSFAQNALAELLDLSRWSDGVLLAGDLGRNSETAILLEKFVAKIDKPLAITKDAVEYVVSSPEMISVRTAPILLVLSLAQLQKLASKLGFVPAITFDMDLLRLIEALHDFTTSQANLLIIIKHLGQLFCALDGQVTSTKLAEDIDIWRLKTASLASVWWIQNQSRPLEALTTAVHQLRQQ